jgi:hypothetical protein
VSAPLRRSAPPLPGLALSLVLVLGVACGSRGKGAHPGSGEAPTAEERFGNDVALVNRFAALKPCTFQDGKLDRACPQLDALQRELARARSDPERKAKVVTTLCNLLESERELSRFAAADSLYPEHREPKVLSALRARLPREPSPAVKTALLRQLCWEPGTEARAAARELARATGPEALRLEAIACLGRGRSGPEVVSLLRELLRAEKAAPVRVSLCAALAELAATEAIPELAAQLDVPDADWRCATALAALGSEAAYRELQSGARRGLERGRLSAQLVSALSAFSEKPFFEREPTVALLARIAAETRLSAVTRQRASAELARLGGR